jgi:glycosyltransferase involved in cell wall biosynthesis
VRAAFVTPDDPFDLRTWSGVNLYMARALERQGLELDYVGPLPEPFRLATRVWGRLVSSLGGRRPLPRRSLRVARAYAREVAARLQGKELDLVFSTGTLPIAFLETPLPIAMWADAAFAAMVGFYPEYSGGSRRSVEAGHRIEGAAIARTSLAVYESEWAARAALDAYGLDAKKLMVVPFGANFDQPPAREAVERRIAERRASESWRLLFIGVDWERKGGATAVETVRLLNERGIRATLVVVGSEPPIDPKTPFVESRGFVSKHTAAGQAELHRILMESHLLLHPARADSGPLAIAEGNAFGLPAIASDVGGMSTLVADGRNGYLVAAAAGADVYADHCAALFRDRERYAGLALTSLEEYEQRLNWDHAGAVVVAALRQLVSAKRSRRVDSGTFPSAHPAQRR